VHAPSATPFRHAGEKRRWTLTCGEYGLSFDHNLHALGSSRTSKLRYARFRGLNLTLNARRHHQAFSRLFGTKKKKPVSRMAEVFARSRCQHSKPSSSIGPTEIAYDTAISMTAMKSLG